RFRWCQQHRQEVQPDVLGTGSEPLQQRRLCEPELVAGLGEAVRQIDAISRRSLHQQFVASSHLSQYVFQLLMASSRREAQPDIWLRLSFIKNPESAFAQNELRGRAMNVQRPAAR